MLTVYTGPMFSGKTTSLVAEAKIAAEVGKTVLAIKPELDTRYEKGDIVTHDGISFWEDTKAELQIVSPEFNFVSTNFLTKALDYDLLLIDEAQFFENAESIIELSQDFDCEVVCSGLDLDSYGKPFGKMPLLLSYANLIVKCHGTCSSCGKPSTRSLRKTSGSSIILVGGQDLYDPKCYKCWKSNGLAQ